MAPKKAGGGAKTASKNNPTLRAKQADVIFMGKKVIPAKYIGSGVGHGDYISMVDESGNLVRDVSGIPYKWSVTSGI